MQDRFKFRIWDKPTSKMFYDVALGFIKAPMRSDWVCADTPDGQISYTGNRLKDIEIMQCTGRIDVADTLIYENDIVTVTGKNGFKPTYIVKYDNCLYKWVLVDDYSHLKGKVSRDFYKEYIEPKKLYKEGYRVIGNIYENPELLKE